MRKISMLLTLVLVTMLSYTQNIAIIPQPAEIKINTGKFQMNTNTALVLKNGADQNAANFLNE